MSNDQTKIMKCECKHEEQDKLYGKGMRVHNPAPQKGASPNRVRCTVCRKERNAENKPF
jgi:hypothetical protein